MTRPSYCRSHAYRAPAPIPMATRKPTTNERPNRRASERRRRGRAGGSKSAVVVARGRTGSVSTPDSEVADMSAAAVAVGGLSQGRTSAASSGSPAGTSLPDVEVSAATSAASSGRSVIRCSSGGCRGGASSLTVATSSRRHAILSRHVGDYDAGRPSDVSRGGLSATNGDEDPVPDHGEVGRGTTDISLGDDGACMVEVPDLAGPAAGDPDAG